MHLEVNGTITPQELMPAIRRAVELAAEKTLRLDRRWSVSDCAPVFTVGGQYTARGWTQWTQGFQYGNALLCFELGGNEELLALARRWRWRVRCRCLSMCYPIPLIWTPLAWKRPSRW